MLKQLEINWEKKQAKQFLSVISTVPAYLLLEIRNWHTESCPRVWFKAVGLCKLGLNFTAYLPRRTTLMSISNDNNNLSL